MQPWTGYIFRCPSPVSNRSSGLQRDGGKFELSDTVIFHSVNERTYWGVGGCVFGVGVEMVGGGGCGGMLLYGIRACSNAYFTATYCTMG